FVPKLPVEALDEGVLDRLAGPDEAQPHAARVRQRIERAAAEFRAVVHDQDLRQANRFCQAVEDTDDAQARERAVDFDRDTLPSEVVDDVQHAKAATVGQRVHSVHGAPRYLRSDNAPEFVARAILRWLLEAQIETALIDPGKPWQNATDESFNGRLRDEYLSVNWFRNRVDAKVGIEQWRRHYNEVRPHSSLEYLTPYEFKATC